MNRFTFWFRQRGITVMAGFLALGIAVLGLWLSGVVSPTALRRTPLAPVSQPTTVPTPFAVGAAPAALSVATRVPRPTSAPQALAVSARTTDGMETVQARASSSISGRSDALADVQLVFSATEHRELREAVVAAYGCALTAQGQGVATLDTALSEAAARVGSSGAQPPTGVLEVSTYSVDLQQATTDCTVGGLDLRTVTLPAGMKQVGVAVALPPETATEHAARIIVLGR